MGIVQKSEILGADDLQRAVARMAHEILERNRGAERLVLIGIETRGVPLALRIAEVINRIEGTAPPVGRLDITLYRDDLQTIAPTPVVRPTVLPFDVTGKKVVLVDDVLFTGRTARAALDQVIDFGRPERIQLAVLIDRGDQELPIRADFVGKYARVCRHEIVQVELAETDHVDRVTVAEVA